MTAAEQALPQVAPLVPRRPVVVFALLGFATALLMVLNVGIGSVSFSPSDVCHALANPHDASTMTTIVWKIRIPRAIAAVLGGAYLAASGLLLQVYFRNPIVGPFILGISSGATVMVSIVMLTTLTVGMTVLFTLHDHGGGLHRRIRGHARGGGHRIPRKKTA